MSPFTAVSQSEDFKRRVEKFRSDYPRIDDSVRGIIWRLQRAPEDGYKPGPPAGPKYMMMVFEKPTEDLPGLLLVYEYENNNVILKDLQPF